MAYTDNLGYRYLPKITPGQNRLFQAWVRFCIEGCSDEHPQNSPDCIPAALAKGPSRGCRTITKESPANPKDQATENSAAQHRRASR